jgi:hypothetical protein
MNFNAKDAKRIRKGAQRKLSSATFAQDFATFAVKFNDLSNTLAGGFGFGSQSGTSAAGGTESGNRRIEVQLRFSF